MKQILVLLSCQLLLCHPSTPDTGMTQFASGNSVRVWYCNSLGQGLNTSSRMVMVLPTDTTWNNPGICNVPINRYPCYYHAPSPAGAHVVNKFTYYIDYNSVSTYGVYYECSFGQQMHSGSPGQLTQCVAGTWTSINDYCVQGTTLAPVISPYTGVNLYQSSQTQVKVWSCPTPTQALMTNTRLMMALPGDPTWSNPGSLCTVTINATQCSGSPPYPADATVMQNFTDNSVSLYGVYYECNPGQVMMSGSPGQLTQCVAGNWTNIFDLCVDGKSGVDL